LKDRTIFKARGCEFCSGIGFRGRIGLFEMMQMNNEIRSLAFDRAATNKIRKAALASGMKSCWPMESSRYSTALLPPRNRQGRAGGRRHHRPLTFSRGGESRFCGQRIY